jgi:N-acetylglucosamine repressor
MIMSYSEIKGPPMYDEIFWQNGNFNHLSNLNRKKYYQKKSVIYHLYSKGLLSNPEICKLTNMSSPSIQKLLKELIGESLVREEGFGHSLGGRRPNLYGLNPDSRFIIAINISLNNVDAAIFNINNQLIGEISILNEPLANSPEFVEKVHRFCNTLIEKYGVAPEKILGMGIGLPGLTDPATGKSYSYLNYDDKTVREIFQEKFRIPVFVDNDARVMALGELMFGNARNKTNVLCLNIGAGIGLGMLLNGSLYIGHSGFAGEFGHIKVEENGRQCICGKFGCLETVASGDALVKLANKEIAAGKPTIMKHLAQNKTENISCALVAKAAHLGDQLAISLLAATGEYLGKGLSTLIHLFNPEAIIIGGKMSLAGQFIIDPIQQTLNRHTILKIKNDTVITVSALGEKSAVMGAMALAINNIFDDVKHAPIV